MSNEKREQQIRNKAKELGQKYFPDEANVWARGNIEAEYVESACIEMAEWADQHPQWIPVEEELPKLTIDDWRSEDVFFATDDGKNHFGFYSNKGVWFSSVYGFNGHQVTHWMPLPPAPRKEE